MLAAMLAEITLAMPLLGDHDLGRHDRRAAIAAGPAVELGQQRRGGAGRRRCGSDGAAPRPATVTSNPGRVIVCEAPFSPVTVTPLP